MTAILLALTFLARAAMASPARVAPVELPLGEAPVAPSVGQTASAGVEVSAGPDLALTHTLPDGARLTAPPSGPQATALPPAVRGLEAAQVLPIQAGTKGGEDKTGAPNAPKVGGEEFSAALSGFSEAAHTASEGGPGGGSGGAALAARFDGSAAPKNPFAGLASGIAARGFASADAQALLAPGLRGEILRLYDAWVARPKAPAKENIEFNLYDAGGTTWGSAPEVPAHVAAGLRAFMESLVAGLNAGLPGEDLYIGQVGLRFVKDEVPTGGFPHIDMGDYLTMTLELHPDSTGTTLYEVHSGGRVTRIETPSGHVAVLAGSLREFALEGAVAPVHSAPVRPVPRRVTFVAHIASRSGDFRRDTGAVMEAGDAREAAVRAAFP